MMQLTIGTDGCIRCIYDETIDLTTLGSLNISRASHVEPDGEGRWWADLQPVGGPKLGSFDHRSEALAAERLWLDAHWLQDKR